MSWKSELRRQYGLSISDYGEMLAGQGARCAICRRVQRAAAPRLAVDHDHVSGLVRGLLCARCNHQFLGMFGDDAEFYQRAADYLRDSPAVHHIGYRFVPDSPGAAGLLKGQ